MTFVERQYNCERDYTSAEKDYTFAERTFHL